VLRASLYLLASSLAGSIACDPGEPAPTSKSAPEPEPTPNAAAQPAAVPEPTPPAAPKGAAWIPEIDVLVQRCGSGVACLEAPQAEGEAHCASLELDGQSGWRMPTKEELEAMRGEDLEAMKGYHFSSTPYAEDDKQVWIVDPSGGSQATTIPRDRKPFRIRCVKNP
jgi:hypothetical protein